MAIASDYAGLWVWLDADTGFAAQSGNSRVITLPGGTQNPTVVANDVNGHSAFQFAGASQQYFTLPSLAALTSGEIFAVVKKAAYPAASSALAGMWNLGSQDFDTNDPWTDGAFYEGFGTSVRKSLGAPAASVTKYFIYNVSSAAGAYSARINAHDLFSTATNTVSFPATPTVGRSLPANSRYLDGKIAQLFIYSQVRTNAERWALAQSLAERYAMAFGTVVSTLIQTSTTSSGGGTGGVPGTPPAYGQRFPRGEGNQ